MQSFLLPWPRPNVFLPRPPVSSTTAASAWGTPTAEIYDKENDDHIRDENYDVPVTVPDAVQSREPVHIVSMFHSHPHQFPFTEKCPETLNYPKLPS